MAAANLATVVGTTLVLRRRHNRYSWLNVPMRIGQRPVPQLSDTAPDGRMFDDRARRSVTVVADAIMIGERIGAFSQRQ